MKNPNRFRKLLAFALCAVIAGGAGAALPNISSIGSLSVSALQSADQTETPAAEKNMTSKMILNYTSATLGKGETFNLTAINSETHSKYTSVTWKSSNTGVATVSDGKITAKAIGTATITATLTNGTKATCQITVKAPASSVSLNKTSLSIGTGETYQFISSVKEGASFKRSFTSSDSSVLKITETTTGTCTAKALKTGTATITVKTYNGKTATCRVTVVTSVTSISLNKTSLTMGKGETFTLKATVNPSNAYDKRLTWKSSDPNIVSVSSGKITAQNTGTATITARSSNGKKASCTVTVKAPAASISFKQKEVTVGVGETPKLQSSVTDGASLNRTFSSSDSSVARIIETTPGTCTVKAVAAGTATVTVRTFNGKTATCKVTVKPAAASIQFKKTSLNMGVNESYQLLTTVPNGTSNTRTFTSSNTSIIRITQTTTGTCTIKALKTGTATVTVKTHNGKTATCKVTVKKLSTSVSLQTNRTLLKIGSTFRLKCTYNADSAIANPIYYVRDTNIVSIVSSDENSFTIKALKKGQTYASVILPNKKVASCLIVVPDQSTNNQPIIFTDFKCGKPDSAGGVDVFIDIYNNSNKTIKSITYTVRPYNAAGQVVSSEIGNKTDANLKFTGPVAPHEFSKTEYKLDSYISDSKIIYDDNWYYHYWSTVWYNQSIASIRLISARIQYTDGTVSTL